MRIDLTKLTIRQKLGQLLMVGFEGRDIPVHMEQLFRDYHIGNIIYFRRNVAEHTQVSQLSEALQQLSGKYNGIPLSIAIDQEGGMVARIDKDITVMPGQMTLGATGNVDHAYEAGRISGMELAQMGITINFAPVLDVNNNPQNPVIGIRSFGEHAELVAQFGVKMIDGYQSMGISACAKHFPGHGDTTADSHYELPSVAHGLERIHDVELVPFKAAIEAGVDQIMTAHVQFPALEPEGKPATLSYRVLTELLREELGFEGLIVTDCLEMNAISQGIGVGRGAVEAFKAGADLILVSHLIERQFAAFHALEAAFLAGEFDEARIDQSVERVLAMKRKQHTRMQLAKAQWHPIHNDHSQAIRDSLMQDAVTLVQDKNKRLPLAHGERTLVIWPEVRQSTEVDEVIDQHETLGTQLKQLGVFIDEVVVGVDPTEDECSLIQQKLLEGQYDQVVIGMYNATFSAGQQALIVMLQQQSTKSIFVSLRNPYDFALLGEQDTYICAYENRPAMIRALSLAMVGLIPFKGHLPAHL